MFLFTPLSVFQWLKPYVFVFSALALFIASAFIGIWVTYDASLAWPVLLALLVSVSLFLVIASSAISPWQVSRGLVIIAGLVAFYFVSQYAHFNYEGETGFLAHLGRLTGSLMPGFVLFIPHPNAVASFLEGAFLISLVLIGQAYDRRRWIWVLMTAIIAYGLLISGSRGAWLGITLAMGIWILLIFRERARQLTVLAGGLVVGIGSGIYIVTRLAKPGQHILILSSAFDTAQSRLILYQNSLQLLKDYPFTGIGLGDTFAMIYSRYQLLIHVPYLYYAHNLFLSVALGQGVLGLVGLVGLLVIFYRFVIRVERIGLDENERTTLLFRAAWLGVTASLVHGLMDSSQFSGDVWTMPMLFALAGLAVNTGRRVWRQVEPAEISKDSSRLNYLKWLGGGAIVVALAIVFVVFWQPLTSVWYANTGAVYHTKADPVLAPDLDDETRKMKTDRAVAYFQRALETNPDQPVANFRLGLIALDQYDFETALVYLERAYAQEPTDQGILKALGYAYLWTGELDLAEERFREVDFNSGLVDEFSYWHWWWGTQDRDDLATYSGEMAQRFTGELSQTDADRPEQK
jgi:O-antigen ligase